MKTTAAKMSNGVFSEEADDFGSGVEKEVCDLVNQPGQQRDKLHPDIFEAVGHCFSDCFQTFCDCPNNRPNSDACSKKDSHHVFLKISLIISWRGMAASLSTTWACKRASSSFISSILSFAASLSEDDVSVASMIAWFSAFCCRSSLSRSFRSSSGFVLFSLSSIMFLYLSFSASLDLSLSTFLCNSRFFFTCFSSEDIFLFFL